MRPQFPGRCVGMNGKKMTPLEVIVEANKIGGRNGVGAWLLIMIGIIYINW